MNKESIFGNVALPPSSDELFSSAFPTNTGLDSSGFNPSAFADSLGGSSLSATSNGFDLGAFMKSFGGGNEGIFGSFGEGLNKVGGLSGLGDILGAGAGIFGAMNGKKQLDMSQDAFDFQKAAFNTNLANQATLTNNQLGDRNEYRQAAEGVRKGDAGYVNRDTYLKKHGVSGAGI